MLSSGIIVKPQKNDWFTAIKPPPAKKSLIKWLYLSSKAALKWEWRLGSVTLYTSDSKNLDVDTVGKCQKTSYQFE